jgi:hypothetical protein
LLKPIQSLRRNHALNLWTGAKAKSEELPFLRSRHRALGLIHFEFELLCDEPRYAFHYPLTGPLLLSWASVRPLGAARHSLTAGCRVRKMNRPES